MTDGTNTNNTPGIDATLRSDDYERAVVALMTDPAIQTMLAEVPPGDEIDFARAMMSTSAVKRYHAIWDAWEKAGLADTWAAAGKARVNGPIGAPIEALRRLLENRLPDVVAVYLYHCNGEAVYGWGPNIETARAAADASWRARWGTVVKNPGRVQITLNGKVVSDTRNDN